MLFSLTFGLIFLACSVAFFTGAALRWVTGWQHMPQEEKDKVNIKPLCRNIAAVLAMAGIAFVCAGLFPAFRENAFRWVMIGWLVLSGLDVYFIGKSKRYSGKAVANRK